MADIVPRSDGLGGRPGTRWRNPTDATWYQLVSSLRQPCADCLRLSASRARSSRPAASASFACF